VIVTVGVPVQFIPVGEPFGFEHVLRTAQWLAIFEAIAKPGVKDSLPACCSRTNAYDWPGTD